METLRIGSTGPTVALLQSILKKTGYLAGAADGRFGPITQAAVMAFQRAHRLTADGIVGRNTWSALTPYINGYAVHTRTNADTIWSLSRAYQTAVARIIAANPGIDPYNLQNGQRIIVPFGTVVPTDIGYTHDILMMNLRALSVIYPFLEVGSVGRSALRRDIPYIRVGTGPKEVFYNGAAHANEWITAPLLMKFIENLCLAYVNNTPIFGYHPGDILSAASIYIAPMVNPDGVDLVTGALNPSSDAYRQAALIGARYPAIPFPSGWKANIQGIDLNLQYPAGWEQARQIKYAQGFTTPAPRDWVGTAPLTAPESLAAYQFTLAHDFRLILAYHTQGRVIYWKYLNYNPHNAAYIGAQFARASGYALEETPYASSFAGYKDWFIQEFNRPGYTIEAGLGVSPLPISQFDTIYRENEGILVLGAVLAP